VCGLSALSIALWEVHSRNRYAKLIDDPDHSDDEERFVLLGLSSSLKVVLVSHCYREEVNMIRIISARKASTHESKQYR
jgi:uncharacterized DUF497 family protein